MNISIDDYSNIYNCLICGYFQNTKPENDICPKCKSRARHRQIKDVINKIGNIFFQKKVLATFANNIEITTFLKDSDLTNFDIRPVAEVNFQMDVQDMSRIPNEEFEIFFSVHVLNHVPDDSKALKEIYRVLKPGGLFFVTIPYRLNEPTTKLNDVTEHYGVENFEKYGVGTYRRYGYKDFISLNEDFQNLFEYEGFDGLTKQNMKVFIFKK